MSFNINDDIVITDDRIVQILSGPTASRPISTVVGMMFYNTTSEKIEVYDGANWQEAVEDKKSGRTAYGWGANGGLLGASGAVGDGTAINRSSPVSVIDPNNNVGWIQLSAGNYHTIGLKANGVAYAWGNNSAGTLGDGTSVDKSSPVLISGGFTNWIYTVAGPGLSLGITSEGIMYSWGNNNFGQLGDGTTVGKSSPVSLVGGFTDWVQASVGGFSNLCFSLAVRANGTAWAWGRAVDGQLGDNTTSIKNSPVSVAGGFTDWIQVSAGFNHGLGVRANGTAWAWGSNVFGQIGDGTTINRSSPVSVVGGFTDWIQVSANKRFAAGHSIGIRANGTAWAWGSGGNGVLGDGTITNKSSPVSVIGGFTDWVQVSAGSAITGVRANGTAWTWGRAADGRLGDETTINKSSPILISGGFTTWVQTDSGDNTSLGIIIE